MSFLPGLAKLDPFVAVDVAGRKLDAKLQDPGVRTGVEAGLVAALAAAPITWGASLAYIASAGVAAGGAAARSTQAAQAAKAARDGQGTPAVDPIVLAIGAAALFLILGVLRG